jgi:hypothetical protein
MSDSIPETTVFLVHNGGEYEDYEVLAAYTDKAMAEEYANAANGVIWEVTANVPKEKWTHACGKLDARKVDGKWRVTMLYAWGNGISVNPEGAGACLGHYSGWGEPDPVTGEYTSGYAHSAGKTRGDCKRMCLDAFTEIVARLDNGTAIEVKD